MKKSLITILMVFTFLSILVGCEKKEVLVDVVVTYWNGWDSSYVSPVEEYEFNVKEKSSFEVVNANGGKLVVTIEKVSNKEVAITTDKDMCIHGNDGTILTDYTKSFTIPVDGELTIVTPTSDEGILYTFKIRRE